MAAAEPKPAPAREPWWHGLRGLLARPAVGMAALIILIAGVGGGWLLRGSDTVEPAPSLVTADPVGSAPPSARRWRSAATPAPCTCTPCRRSPATRSTRSGSSGPA